MIVDGHMHIFTWLNGPGGYDSAERHLSYIKGNNSMPIRRKRDNAIISAPIPWDRVRDFRAEKLGRYEWSLDGEEYFVQQFSPSLQSNTSSPEFVIAQMDYVGIDVAVLQHDTVYGRFNDLFGEAQRSYPGRFVGLLKVEEPRAYEPEQLAVLHKCVEEYKLKGLFFQHASFGTTATPWADDPAFDVFWQEVKRLQLPVYLHGTGDYGAIYRLATRYPDTDFIFLIPQARFARESQVHVPDNIDALMSLPNVLAEICPIAYGFKYEYPYTEMHAEIRPLYEAYGGSKFCWGSDMPNLERFCTYLQGLDFLRRHCAFITREDMKLIVGDNLARVFRLAPAG